MFVGFRADQKRFLRMLDRMTGRANGTRYALTHYTLPITGSCDFVPSIEGLPRLRSSDCCSLSKP